MEVRNIQVYVGVDFGNNLELLALTDVLGLADGGLEAGESFVVEGLVGLVFEGGWK